LRFESDGHKERATQPRSKGFAHFERLLTFYSSGIKISINEPFEAFRQCSGVSGQTTFLAMTLKDSEKHQRWVWRSKMSVGEIADLTGLDEKDILAIR
jgi:hypothetical protein